MKEVVLFNKDGKEIDWYDPVEKPPLVINGNLKIDNGIYTYSIPLSSFDKFRWREKVEPTGGEGG